MDTAAVDPGHVRRKRRVGTATILRPLQLDRSDRLRRAASAGRHLRVPHALHATGVGRCAARLRALPDTGGGGTVRRVGFLYSAWSPLLPPSPLWRSSLTEPQHHRDGLCRVGTAWLVARPSRSPRHYVGRTRGQGPLVYFVTGLR